MARLCAAGLATMEDLLDVDGKWSLALIETMLPEATAIEVRREKAIFRSTSAAVAGMFLRDGAKDYTKGLDAVFDGVKEERRGASQAQAKKEAGQAIVEGFAKMGIVPRNSKPKQGAKK